jgi:hypothetical protein
MTLMTLIASSGLPPVHLTWQGRGLLGIVSPGTFRAVPAPFDSGPVPLSFSDRRRFRCRVETMSPSLGRRHEMDTHHSLPRSYFHPSSSFRFAHRRRSHYDSREVESRPWLIHADSSLFSPTLLPPIKSLYIVPTPTLDANNTTLFLAGEKSEYSFRSSAHHRHREFGCLSMSSADNLPR